MAPRIDLKLLPPEEAIAFFRQKGFQIGFDYRDVWQQEHQAAFTVAKAMQVDLLQDIRAQIDAALVNGTTLQTFISELRPNLVKRGWWGRKLMDDPLTGETKEVQLGSPRRLKVIYDTNLRTAHAEGQWARIQEAKETLPFLMYDHTPSAHERKEHAAWDGLVLPVDDPWWQAHYPVKAWGCKCRAIQVGQRQIDRQGLKVGSAPAESFSTYTNKRTGETQQIPAGVDPAFHYPPGGRLGNLKQMLSEKVSALPPALAAAVTRSAPVFVEAKTARAAAEFAVKNDLADFADYTGVKPEVANAWNRSLFDHLQEFPELRKNQQFVGSAQAQFARWAELARRDYADKLMRSLGMSAQTAESMAAARIKAPKVKGTTFAQSWAQPQVRGIAVNAKWGGAPEVWRATLTARVKSQWFPPGCDTFRAVADHEFGHQLDDLLGLHLDNEILGAHKDAVAKGMKSEVSGYAEYKGSPIKEFIAECWAESLNNPAPRPVARTVAAIVRARYRSKFHPGA